MNVLLESMKFESQAKKIMSSSKLHKTFLAAKKLLFAKKCEKQISKKQQKQTKTIAKIDTKGGKKKKLLCMRN